MGKRAHIFFYVITLLALFGCATTASKISGDLGKSPYKNVVILGEHISKDVAQKYAEKYNATVLYTTGRGFLSDAVSSTIRGTVGPSKAMRDLIVELKSINHTIGEWVLIIPPSAERYFLVTLRNMEDGALRDTNALVFLIKGEKDNNIETELMRVSENKLKVKYGSPSQN